MLNVEDRNFRRLPKRIYASDSPIITATKPRPQPQSKPPPEESAKPEDGREGKAAKPAPEPTPISREEWKEGMLLDFAQFDSYVIRAQLLLNSNRRERDRYAVEKVKIEETARNTREDNASLHEQLVEAQRMLKVRKGYDELAEKITKDKTLKPRDEQQANIAKLNAEIAELEAESQEYAKTWAERREQFGKLVDEGEQLLRLIRDEKEEAERKEGMDDTGDDKGSSRGTTPAGGATPAHVPEAADPPSGSRLREEANAADAGAADADMREGGEEDMANQDNRPQMEEQPLESTKPSTSADTDKPNKPTEPPTHEATHAAPEQETMDTT